MTARDRRARDHARWLREEVRPLFEEMNEAMRELRRKRDA